MRVAPATATPERSVGLKGLSSYKGRCPALFARRIDAVRRPIPTARTITITKRTGSLTRQGTLSIGRSALGAAGALVGVSVIGRPILSPAFLQPGDGQNIDS